MVNGPSAFSAGPLFSLQEVWRVEVESLPANVDSVREAVEQASALDYGRYTKVSFQSAVGLQRFSGMPEGSGEPSETVASEQVVVLSFSIDPDEETLKTVLEAIQAAHSYEEPVVHVTPCFATRANYTFAQSKPSRWWRDRAERDQS